MYDARHFVQVHLQQNFSSEEAANTMNLKEIGLCFYTKTDIDEKRLN